MASTVKSIPKDAQTMAAILEDMGIVNYEPRVIHQMLEFSYKYVTDILEGAAVYSSHAGKRTIDIDDVKIAVQTQLDHTLTNPPPKDLLLDVSRHKNSIALPLVKAVGASVLPNERFCLTGLNFKLVKRPSKRPAAQTPKPAKANGSAGVSTLVSGNKLTNVMPGGIRFMSPGNVALLSASSHGGAASVSSDSFSRKRLREDDEFAS